MEDLLLVSDTLSRESEVEDSLGVPGLTVITITIL